MFDEGPEVTDYNRRYRRALCVEAGVGQFGSTREIAPSPENSLEASKVNLIKISRESDMFSSNPELLAVNLGYRTINPPTRDPLLLFARVTWMTGKGRQDADVDLPARGTSFGVVAGDGLNIDVFRNGGGPGVANAETGVRVRATVGFSASPTSSCGPTRTLQTGAFPMPVGAPLRVPRFARSVTVLSGRLGDFAAATFRFFVDSGGGGVLSAVAVPAAPSQPVRVPLGAEFWDIVGAAGGAPSASVVFELGLG